MEKAVFNLLGYSLDAYHGLSLSQRSQILASNLFEKDGFNKLRKHLNLSLSDFPQKI